VQNQPVNWDGQFEEKNKSGESMKETHSICFLIFRVKPGVQRRITDEAQDQDGSAKQQPRPSRPSLIGAPKAPCCQACPACHVEKARDSRYIRLCRHAHPYRIVPVAGFPFEIQVTQGAR